MATNSNQRSWLLSVWLCYSTLVVAVLAVALLASFNFAEGTISPRALILNSLLIFAIFTSSAIAIVIAAYRETLEAIKLVEDLEKACERLMDKHYLIISNPTILPESSLVKS